MTSLPNTQGERFAVSPAVSGLSMCPPGKVCFLRQFGPSKVFLYARILPRGSRLEIFLPGCRRKEMMSADGSRAMPWF